MTRPKAGEPPSLNIESITVGSTSDPVRQVALNREGGLVEIAGRTGTLKAPEPMSGQKHRLQAMQRDGENWFRIEKPANKTRADDKDVAVATVYIYDEIGFWGVSAKDFADEINALDVDEIKVHINSPGGEVWDGITILNTLRGHPAKVTTIVDGVAASSASFIAMGGDEVVMMRNSELMIHDAWGMAVGNAADLADLAARLDAMSDNIASIYAEKTGGTTEEWREFMRAETWYSAQEAVEAKLADRVDSSNAARTDAKNKFDLTIFNYAGRDHAPSPARTPRASAPGTTTEEKPMADEPASPAEPEVETPPQASTTEADPPLTTQAEPPAAVVTGATSTTGTTTTTNASGADVTVIHVPAGTPTPDPAPAPAAAAEHNQEGAGMQVDPVKLRESLGLNPSASDEEVRAAVVASGFASMTPLHEGAPELRISGRTPKVPEPDPTVVTVDSSILDQLRQDAAAGVEAFQKLFRQERDQTIAAAINEGKFAPARREHWEKAWDKDPEGTKMAIASLSKGLVPMAPIGYMSTTVEAREAEDDLYAQLYGNGGQF
jgi:ATP-dependent Clp endopeptidase proteolytic subunit ClpP